VSSAGAAQTQWCDQDMGEISNPAEALSNRADVTWPALSAPVRERVPAGPAG